MRWFRRGFALLLILLVVLSCMGTSLAAENAPAGETVTVYFSYNNIDSIDGSFYFSNRELFSSVTYVTGEVGAGLVGGIANDRAFFSSAQVGGISGRIGVTVTLSSSANVGDSCTITFRYETSSDGGNTMSEWKSAQETVAVTSAGSTGSTETSQTSGEGSSTSSSSNGITVYDVNPMEMTELNRQIGIAESLQSSDYTKESWAALQAALNDAYGQLGSTSQDAVDAAASELSDAMSALVDMDYTALQSAMEQAQQLRDSQDLGGLWAELLSELADASSLLTSGDQEAVDQATERIEELVDEIQAAIVKASTPETVEIVNEVEVVPTGRYCNISMHRVWPVLFFISLGINVVLVGCFLFFFLRKRRVRKDTTPLVDYDIEDDFPFENSQET